MQYPKTQGKPDTTSKLWEWYYLVRVPYLMSRTVDDIRRTGVVISGIPEIDRDIVNQLTTTMMTIAQMADYFKEGVPIRVVNYKDTKEIYDAISAHIYSWKEQLEQGINIGDAPIEDLIVLDNLANAVYEHARYQFTRDLADSLLAKHMQNISQVSPMNFFKSRAIKHVQDEPTADSVNGVTHIRKDSDDKKVPDRDSLMEFFKTRIINLRT